jgi:hypothetical protein
LAGETSPNSNVLFPVVFANEASTSLFSWLDFEIDQRESAPGIFVIQQFWATFTGLFRKSVGEGVRLSIWKSSLLARWERFSIRSSAFPDCFFSCLVGTSRQWAASLLRKELLESLLQIFNIPRTQNQLPFKIACLRPDSSSPFHNANRHYSIHIIQTYEQPKTDSE